MPGPAVVATAIVLALALAAAPAGAADREAVSALLRDLQIVPLEGQAPPPLRVEGLDGKPVTLADLRGRTVLLYFWATW